MALCSGLSGVVCTTVPGGSGEGDLADSSELPADVSPCLAGGAFGDADEQYGQPADQDVGADAVLEAVEHRPDQ
ncbi:hypothetical protein [Salinispora arenicola]|uniref:hypothetical protein n=1 Tax=Salinispora arenicola TaxID=168697 RepID=UPI00037165C0|nr:hypothetical protein [Salinispora arenicola]